MFEIETHEYGKANLERLAFYYEKSHLIKWDIDIINVK